MSEWPVQFFEACCIGLESVVVGDGAFSPGPAVWVGRREVAHFDEDRVLDIRLTKAEIRARRAELKADERVTLRRSGSEWIEFAMVTDHDEARATQLVRDAAAANAATAPAGLPPTGADLDRRRRFH